MWSCQQDSAIWNSIRYLFQIYGQNLQGSVLVGSGHYWRLCIHQGTKSMIRASHPRHGKKWYSCWEQAIAAQHGLLPGVQAMHQDRLKLIYTLNIQHLIEAPCISGLESHGCLLYPLGHLSQCPLQSWLQMSWWSYWSEWRCSISVYDMA